MISLKDKHALITGGTSGIGLAIAQLYIECGAHVTIVGTNPEKGARALNNLCEHRTCEDQKIAFEKLDVSCHQSVKDSLEQIVSHMGGVEILVNCAGVTRDKLIMKMSEEDWDTVLDINLKSLYNLCHRLVRPMMKARFGKIINISSVIGLMGNAGQVNYSASKAGMIGFTQSLAKELAPRGINVNCIAPGYIETEMTDKLTEEQKKGILDTVPMKRMGSPRDIANAALFLASDLSDYMTGEVFAVDGGMTA